MSGGDWWPPGFAPRKSLLGGAGKKWRFIKPHSSFYALEAPGALSVAPDTITLAASQAAGFSARINDASAQAVTWTIDPPLGTLSATQGATTTYTARWRIAGNLLKEPP